MKEHDARPLRLKRGESQTWQQVSKAGPVVFPDAVEHHSPSRHVHSHSKRLGGKQHLARRRGGAGGSVNRLQPTCI